jgi:hypothetical protein
MIKKIVGLALSSCLLTSVFAQDPKQVIQRTPVKNWYMMNSGELIFSAGELNISDTKINDPTGLLLNDFTDPQNTVRFSGFFHTSQEFHYNFSNAVGFYSGIALRNVGFIHSFKISGEKVKVKNRSYALGIPLALKVGNMQNYFLNIGIEPELMFAYKRKVFYDGDKSKKTQWFSDDVNLFNPSVFVQLNLKGGMYIKAKYYLNDFLANDYEKYTLPDTPVAVSYKIDSNRLFYVSVGSTLKNKKFKKKYASTSIGV